MTQNEHAYATCYRPEVAGEVISSGNENTADGYVALNFEAASFNSFRENKKNQNQPFAQCVDDGMPT